MDEEILYKKAKSLVNKKVKFYRYLYGYIIVNVCLFFINLSEIHYIKVFVLQDRFDDDWMEEKIQKEMDKMRK